MNLNPFGDGRTDGHTGIERAVGVLKDDLHPPPDLPQSGAIEGEDVLPFIERLTAGGLLKAENSTPD
jgi:hypothetical protein